MPYTDDNIWKRLTDIGHNAQAIGIQTHYTCAKGNEHVLSHAYNFDGGQEYEDGCRVHIKVEEGHILHLTVLSDVSLGGVDP